MSELPDDIYQRVTLHSESGNLYSENEQHIEAAAQWKEALALLPTPKKQWEAATWLNASVGEAYWILERKEEACSFFEQAYRSADGHLNPFVLFYLGACYFDMKSPESSTDFLLRAYMLDGETIFNDEDPKYLQHLKDLKLTT